MDRKVILIVEDEPLILMDAVDILRAAGFETLEAASAADAMAKLNCREDISAVFTDIQIVGEPDGLKLAHIVRDRNPPMGLIVTSGQITPTETQLPAGSIFLAKPYSPQALIALLRSVLS